MSSQKSTGAAVEPKRRRGRARVAAILDAGAAVFAEKGYEAATMTEIGARAGAAVGSLYRFFPTKEALADSLLPRLEAALVGAFDEVEAKAGELTSAELAAALIEATRSPSPEKAAGMALVDARPDGAKVRAALRAAIRKRFVAILTKAAPGLAADRAQASAAVLMHVLKSLRTLPSVNPEFDAAAAGEARSLIAIYLASLAA